MHHLRAGHRHEHHRGEVRGRAIALGPERDFARTRPHVIDELLDRVDRQVLAHDHHVGRGGDQRKRNELLRLVGELPIERLVDRKRPGRAHQQRVAVGLGMIGGIGADIAAGAGLVLHHHRLAPLGRQLVAEDARQHVIGAAAGEGDDETDGTGGEGGLREDGRGYEDCKRAGDACDDDAFHLSSPRACFFCRLGRALARPNKLPRRGVGSRCARPNLRSKADSAPQTRAGSGPGPAAPRRRRRRGSCRH